MKDNIRKLMNIMNKVQEDKTPIVFVYLDAEKAFDRIEWVYLKRLIGEFGIGSYFAKWLDLIYKDQDPMVLMEGYKTR